MYPRLAERYAAFLLRRRCLVLAVAGLACVIGAAAAARLPLRTDFADLLPSTRTSVLELDAVRERVAAFGTVFVLVEADDPERRARAAARLRHDIADLGDDLVGHVVASDAEARRYFWDSRFLFADQTELTEVRDALAARVRDAVLDENPLFVDLAADLEPEQVDEDWEQRSQALRDRLEEARAELEKPSSFVSRNGDLQLLVVRAPFPDSEVSRGRALVSAIEERVRALERDEPGVRVGLAGTIITSLGEHRSILHGMIEAAALTVLLVITVLLLYFRSALLVLAVLGALAVGCLVTFGLALITVGELNLATAFLAAIVVGNGINPNVMVAARFREERCGGAPLGAALALALRGSFPGTLAASLTAAVAYGSLMVTEFSGFRHFGVIGGIGMLTCWLSAYTVLPAALALVGGRVRAVCRRSAVESVLGRIGGWSARAIALGLSLATALAVWMSLGYLRSDPIENDWRRLSSHNAELAEAEAWNDRLTSEFDSGFNHNLSGRFVIAAPDQDTLRRAVDALREADAGRPEDERSLAYVRSLDDVIPTGQHAKLALLAEIRELIDDAMPDLEEDERELAAELRPPDELAAIGPEDVPDELAQPFTESDGAMGRVAWATSSDRFDSWNVRDLVDFGREIDAIDLPDDVLLGGQAFVFADMLEAMEEDIPRATIVVVAGSVLAVAAVVGFGCFGLVVLGCTLIGTLGMVALVAAFGLKVNFLDFIALPITIGIGVDYAANLVARSRQGGLPGRELLQKAGGAVVLTSLTTIIGYGSLLLSDNAGIRSFGLASVLGEITCLAAAILTVVAVARILTSRARARSSARRR